MNTQALFEMVVVLLLAHMGCAQECGGEWESYGGSCYLFRNERVGWRMARQRCINSISDLVVITSEAENNYVQGKVTGNGIEYYWIGLHDTSDEGYFIWVDGQYLTATGYSNFRTGEPNNAELPGEDCGEMNSNNGKWNDETCVDLNGYVCERKLNQPVQCDANNGWHENNGRCYWWSGLDREVYKDAKDVCSAFGGHIVSIGTDEEQQYIQNIQALEGLPFWIGLTDRDGNNAGDFIWDDPATPYSYTHWGPNQPDLKFYTATDFNCVQIGANRVANGNWSTDSCRSKHYFICEKDPGVCPNGWELFNGFCYQRNQLGKTYTDAKHYCETQGGYLLTVTSDAENQFVTSKLMNFYWTDTYNIWLGISDILNDDVLQWEHGSPMDGYSNWNTGQPSLVAYQEDCGSIYTGYSDGKWDTSTCYQLQGFMCKAQVGATLNPVQPGDDYGACELGWNLFDESCYFFSEDVLVYSDAKVACIAVEAQLTSITSAGEQSFITTRMDFIRTNMWIGLNDIATNRQYVWEDGSPYNETTFQNWSPGEPTGSTYEDCVHLESEYFKLGMWNDISCTYSHRYICKKDKLPPPPTTLAPTPPPATECGEGWTLNNVTGRCYFVEAFYTKVYDDARYECRQLGADLVSIHSLAENQFVRDMFVEVSTSAAVYIGLNDQYTEGGFEWTDGSPLNYLNWNTGEPNNFGGGEDCSEIIANNGKWNDITCAATQGYICKANDYLQAHYNVTRSFGLRYSYQAYYVGVQAEECGRLCEAQTSFLCLSFDVDKLFKWCQLYDHTKDDPDYDFSYDINYDHYTRVFDFPTEAPPMVLPNTYGCKSGWTGFGNDCYLLVDTTADYDTHRAFCQGATNGADVVSIPTIHINNFVNAFIVTEEMKYQYIYIGLTDENQEGLYEWADGSEVKLTPWAPNQPSNDPVARDCTEMNADTGLWSDVDCGYYDYTICKAPKFDTGSVVIEPTPTGCPNGYIRYYFSCYRIVTDNPRTWKDATADCGNNREQLVVITTSFENAFLGARVGLDLEDGMYWTGLSDTETPGSYKFVDGSVPTYVNWAPGQPNDQTGNCVAMYSGSDTLSGLWTDTGCYLTLPYICEKPADGATLPPFTTVAPTVPSDTGCQEGWYGYGDNCFWVFDADDCGVVNYALINCKTDPLTPGKGASSLCHVHMNYDTGVESDTSNSNTFSYAQSACEDLGANLASFGSPEEEEYVKSRYLVLNPNDVEDYWIGLTDENDEGNWFWTDGSPVVYVNWNAGEPNDHEGIEECVLTSFNSNWNDAYCYRYEQYICKRPKNYVVPTEPPPNLPQCPSDRDWLSAPPYCYFATAPTGEGLNSWTGADNWCRNKGGYLASITTNYEAQVIRGVVDPAVASYWIGLKQTSSGNFEWSDGQPYSYVNWKTDQPNNKNGEESCVEIDVTTGNKWQDKNCGIAAPFICKRAEGSVEPIPTPTKAIPGGGCDSDWYYHSGRCYYVGGTVAGDRFDWLTAKSRCVNTLVNAGETGNLATIHSHEEQVFFTSLLKFISVDVWIGLSDLAVDGQYVWTDQYQVTYTNWKPGKPDNTDLNDCVEMQNDYDFAGVWSNVRCSNEMGYICQKNADPDLGPGQVVDFGPCEMPGFEDYRAYGESCFKLVNQLQTYNQARDSCVSDGATLATVVDTFDQAFIELTLDINNVDAAWIGLTDQNAADDEQEFAWEDGWPVYFTKWGAFEPSQETGEGCVYTDAMNGWNNTVCTEVHRSICKVTTAEKPPTAAPVEGECLQGWMDSGYACYWYDSSVSAVPWAEAEYICNQLGGNLPSIHSKAENEYINDMVGTVGNAGHSIWIGLRKNSQGGYEWTDGTPTDYTHWNNEEPSGDYRGTPEDCVELYTNLYGKWNDVDCYAWTRYVCQRPKGNVEGPVSTERPVGPSSEPVTGGLSTGAIVGIVLASVFMVCLVVFLVFFFISRRQGPTTTTPPHTSDFPTGFDNASYATKENM